MDSRIDQSSVNWKKTPDFYEHKINDPIRQRNVRDELHYEGLQNVGDSYEAASGAEKGAASSRGFFDQLKELLDVNGNGGFDGQDFETLVDWASKAREFMKKVFNKDGKNSQPKPVDSDKGTRDVEKQKGFQDKEVQNADGKNWFEKMLLDAADGNGDGKMGVMDAFRMYELLSHMDANNDGALNQADLNGLLGEGNKELKQAITNLIEKFDKNGDDQIDWRDPESMIKDVIYYDQMGGGSTGWDDYYKIYPCSVDGSRSYA